MPLYDFDCEPCGLTEEHFRSIAEREDGPPCPGCDRPMKMVISPVRGFVYFPAAGGHGYVSQTSGKFIDTQRARREDLKRTGCRPWEGFDSESGQAARDKAHAEAKEDVAMTKTISEHVAQLPSEKKRALGI